ncbi:hypothetical protein [Yersinia ruckeri]|uniref:hypothetical protein n=1 Tax=Yersinia ruckeri TaxID=29486 RepID=UPI0020BDB360|nr:hypothetical protein [Yersinia ruckeri]EKN4689525.1 hypothetical protein [Yersinia ruckeri]MCK8586359.1 hypothetical protein [Yersinia ruckeri]MCW6615601.1 hypothetical protein [Yersinia ruckeri]
MQNLALRDFTAVELKKNKRAARNFEKAKQTVTIFFSTVGVVFILNTVYTLASQG